MTALARVSLTGSYETGLERFKDASSTDAVAPSYEMLATDRNWTELVPTATFSGGTISLTDGASCRLRTRCRKYPYVGVRDVPAVNGLMILHLQSSGGGRSLKIDMNGTVYDGWAGQAKLTDTAPNDLARVWLSDTNTGFGQLYNSVAGMTWAVGNIGSSPLPIRPSDISTLNATAGYTCSATAGVSIQSGYVNQYGTTSSMLTVADNAFDNGFAPLLQLTISGTIATYINEDLFDPSKIGDGWPGDGTYKLWQLNSTQWRWRGTPTLRSDGNTTYDEITLEITGPSGGSYGLLVYPRRGSGAARFNTGFTISPGSLDGLSLSAYSIARTAAQSGYAGEGSATCALDSA